jgi:hypothetical protein
MFSIACITPDLVRVDERKACSASHDGRGGVARQWCTSSGLEVDCVVYAPDLFWAIEVKRSARIDRRDLAGLKAFGADDPQAERLLLPFAPEPLLIDGIRCEPLEP